MTEYERWKTDWINTYNLILKRHYLEETKDQIRFHASRKKELEDEIRELEKKLS